MTSTASNSETWFQRVLWVGIAGNIGLAAPALLWPAQLLAMSGLPPAVPLMWVRFSSLLLILLSAFYVPAALDCRRARLNGWLATASRLAGVLFFLSQPSEYWLLGAYDFVFFLAQGLLLLGAGPVSAKK